MSFLKNIKNRLSDTKLKGLGMLQNMNLRGKIFVASSVVGFIVSAVLGFLIYQVSVVPVEQKVSNKIVAEMQAFIDSQIELKIQAGIIGSTALSIQTQVAEALEVEEREELIDVFSAIRDQYRNQTNYKNIQTQLITADGRSLIKSWNINSYGQNLTNSPLIQRSMKEKQAFGSLAIGGRGVSIIAISPVMYEGEFYGMISMIQGLASVRKNFTKRTGGQWILLVDQNYVKDRYGSMPVIEKNTQFNVNYIVANDKWFPAETIEFAKNAFEETNGDKTNIYFNNGKVIIDLPAIDEYGKVFGRHQFILDEQAYNQPIEDALLGAEISLAGILVAILALTLTLVLVFNLIVINPLRKVKQVTANILSTGDFSIRCPVKGKDEISETSDAVNHLLENVANALNEANNTVHSLSEGDFSQRMSGKYEGDLRKLKDGINGSTQTMDMVMQQISTVISALRDSNYDVKINLNSKGRYRQILKDAQEAVETSKNIVREINDTMDKMQGGQFDTRVNIEAKGEFGVLKTHINESLETLSKAINEIKT